MIIMTLLASNKHGALVGNDLGQVTFLDGRYMTQYRNEIFLAIPRVSGNKCFGIVVPDLINFGPDRFIDFRAYKEESCDLSAIAAFDDEARIWFVAEKPSLPLVFCLD